MRPAVGASSPAIRPSSVDLPLPDGPVIARNCGRRHGQVERVQDGERLRRRSSRSCDTCSQFNHAARGLAQRALDERPDQCRPSASAPSGVGMNADRPDSARAGPPRPRAGTGSARCGTAPRDRGTPGGTPACRPRPRFGRRFHAGEHDGHRVRWRAASMMAARFRRRSSVLQSAQGVVAARAQQSAPAHRRQATSRRRLRPPADVSPDTPAFTTSAAIAGLAQPQPQQARVRPRPRRDRSPPSGCLRETTTRGGGGVTGRASWRGSGALAGAGSRGASRPQAAAIASPASTAASSRGRNRCRR